MAHILIPIPARDFDPTEVAVSWHVLRTFDHSVSFATPDGAPAKGDEIMITGRGLDFWGFIPGIRRLPLLGLLLRADKNARRAYRALLNDPKFNSPLKWSEVEESGFDGLLLPGGIEPEACAIIWKVQHCKPLPRHFSMRTSPSQLFVMASCWPPAAPQKKPESQFYTAERQLP